MGNELLDFKQQDNFDFFKFSTYYGKGDGNSKEAQEKLKRDCNGVLEYVHAMDNDMCLLSYRLLELKQSGTWQNVINPETGCSFWNHTFDEFCFYAFGFSKTRTSNHLRIAQFVQLIREVETTLCDGRKFEVKPDIVADFTALPFENNRFSMVVFDPPHLTRNTGKSKMADLYGSLNERARPTGYQQIKYGALYSDWRDMLAKGFKECFRVLSPGGFLIFKWNETDIKVSEVLALTSEQPVFGHKSGKQSNTHWLCFAKAQDEL